VRNGRIRYSPSYSLLLSFFSRDDRSPGRLVTPISGGPLSVGSTFIIGKSHPQNVHTTPAGQRVQDLTALTCTLNMGHLSWRLRCRV